MNNTESDGTPTIEMLDRFEGRRREGEKGRMKHRTEIRLLWMFGRRIEMNTCDGCHARLGAIRLMIECAAPASMSRQGVSRVRSFVARAVAASRMGTSTRRCFYAREDEM